MPGRMRVVTFKAGDELLRRFDEAWPLLGFKNRSEAIRRAMEILIREAERRTAGLPRPEPRRVRIDS